MSRQAAAKRASAVLLLLALALAVAAPVAAADPPTSAAGAIAATEDRQWPHVLPFLADEAVKRGYDLPLPFGLSAVYYYIERDVDVSNVRVGLNGSPLRDVSQFVNLGSRSHTSVAVLRFDAWLLPFLDVYALVGSVTNNTTTKGTVTVPRPGPRPGSLTFDVSKKTALEGFVGGVGLSVAGGYRSFFALGDLNYTQTDIGFDDRFKALVGSIRVGWNGKILDAPVRFWVGGVYWGTEATASATVAVPNVGRVSFEALEAPTHPLNATIGASITLFRRWDAFVEYGTNAKDVQTIATGLTFRF
jgi:hypothetical protein